MEIRVRIRRNINVSRGEFDSTAIKRRNMFQSRASRIGVRIGVSGGNVGLITLNLMLLIQTVRCRASSRE